MKILERFWVRAAIVVAIGYGAFFLFLNQSERYNHVFAISFALLVITPTVIFGAAGMVIGLVASFLIQGFSSEAPISDWSN
jgi:hypothetical protein